MGIDASIYGLVGNGVKSVQDYDNIAQTQKMNALQQLLLQNQVNQLPAQNQLQQLSVQQHQIEMQRAQAVLNEAQAWGQQSPSQAGPSVMAGAPGTTPPTSNTPMNPGMASQPGQSPLPPGVARYQGMPVEQLRARINAGLEPKDGLELWKAANIGTAVTAGQYRIIPGQAPQYMVDPSKPYSVGPDGNIGVAPGGLAALSAVAGATKSGELGAVNAGTLNPDPDRYPGQVTIADILRAGQNGVNGVPPAVPTTPNAAPSTPGLQGRPGIVTAAEAQPDSTTVAQNIASIDRELSKATTGSDQKAILMAERQKLMSMGGQAPSMRPPGDPQAELEAAKSAGPAALAAFVRTHATNIAAMPTDQQEHAFVGLTHAVTSPPGTPIPGLTVKTNAQLGADKISAENDAKLRTQPAVTQATTTAEQTASGDQKYAEDLDSRVREGGSLLRRNNEISRLLTQVQTGVSGFEGRTSFASNIRNLFPNNTEMKLLADSVQRGDTGAAQAMNQIMVGAGITSAIQTLDKQGRLNKNEADRFMKAAENPMSDPDAIRRIIAIQTQGYQQDFAEQQARAAAIKAGTYNQRTWQADWAAIQHQGLTNPDDSTVFSPATKTPPGDRLSLSREAVMATYKVQGPDGSIHLIEGPEGASPQDIEAFAAQSIPKAAPQPDDAFTKSVKASVVGSKYDQFMAGAGKAVSDLGSGLGQIYDGIADKVSPLSPSLSDLVTGKMPTRSAGDQASIDETKRLDAPLMNTGAGIAGNVGGNIAMSLLPMGGVAKGAQAMGMARTANVARALVNPTSATTALGTAAAALGSGALTGGLQPVASDENRAVNIGGGAAASLLGQGVVSGLGRIAQPVRNVLDDAQQKAVETLRNAGVPMSLSQLTGSPFLSKLSASFGDNPFTAGAQANFVQGQKGAYNNALLQLIGESGTSASPTTMGNALGRTNGVFSDVLNRNDVPLTPRLATALSDAQAGALENEKQPVANIVNRAFDSVDPATGSIPGQTAYNIVKDMRNMAQGAGQDTTLGHYAGQARSAMMNGVNDALSGSDLAAFTQARQQQAIMRTLEGAIDTKTGDISANKLANIMAQKRNRSISIYGNGPQDLNDLAQAGSSVLRDLPNSGTTARAMAAATLPGMTIGGLDAGYDYLKNGDAAGALGSGAKVAAGMIAAPKIAQYLINSPGLASRLSSGVENNSLRTLLQAPENALIGSAVRSVPSVARQLLTKNPTYEEYLTAFDKAPDNKTKIDLGNEYAAKVRAKGSVATQ